MSSKKVVVPREKDLPVETLLSSVGLTPGQWDTYLAVLERPDLTVEELPDATAATMGVLADLGLMRPSLERALGYAPIPPGPAFSKIMERHDSEVIQSMKAGMQLRKLMRGVSEAGQEPGGAPGSGVEVYEDIDQARDRSYELALGNPGRRQTGIESARRATSAAADERARASSKPQDKAMQEPHLGTLILDREAIASWGSRPYWEEMQEAGETVVRFPGRSIQMILRSDTYLMLWRDPYPSMAATLIVTAPWALLLAQLYIDQILNLCEPWGTGDSSRKPSQRLNVQDLLCQGLTDDQIATRLRLSTRTVGREVALLMEESGAKTRFQAGVLLERRRQTSARLNWSSST